MDKALILFSGGLDSRLAAKLIEEQGYEIHLCFVKLPFGGGCCNDTPCIINFAQTSGYQLHIIDSTKDELFLEYINIVQNPKYGVGKGMNPCKDCKIFIFEQGKKLAKDINAKIIATGEVLAQRPMSQTKSSMLLDDEKSGLKNKILRPLSAKLLPITEYEKGGLIDREKLLKIHGRQRQIQMELAEKYKIKYPSPAGGCLLCEKEYEKKLKALFKYTNNKPTHFQILFLKRGRMYKNNGLIFVGRDEKENLFLETLAKKSNWNILMDKKIPGPYIVYDRKEDEKLVKKLRNAFTSKDLKKRKEFEKFKI